jgi:hypothetical protein
MDLFADSCTPLTAACKITPDAVSDIVGWYLDPVDWTILQGAARDLQRSANTIMTADLQSTRLFVT